MSTDPIEPFGPPSGMSISDMEVETDEDSLRLSGSIEIMRDGRGVEAAKVLAEILRSAIERIETSPGIPPATPGEGATVPNPF